MLLPLIGAASAWTEFASFPCGPTFPEGCQFQNTGDQDQVISLFFQYEPAQGEAAGSFQCHGDGLTYCARSWQPEAIGTAGDCFFVLGAGRSFQCQATGTTTVIGAHHSPLSTNIVVPSAPSRQIPCTGPNGCTYTNTGSDAWVGLTFSAQRQQGQLKCSYGQFEVCGWAVNTAGGASSCNFILPSQATLTCTGTANIGSAQALALSTSVVDVAAPLEPTWNCPNVTYPKPNLCNCGYTNPHTDKDLIVSVTSSSVDNNFNSYHCYYGGANVCAWGSDRNDDSDRGGCYFILAAGQEFACQMEYGAAAFSFSAAVATKQGLFGGAESKPLVKVAGVRGAAAAGPADKLRAAFAAWKVQQKRVYASEAEEALRFRNFKEHVAMAGPKPRYNGLADLSRYEFETQYCGCSFVGKRDPTAAQFKATRNFREPANVDWRNKSVVTPVKSQGQCGSCWTYSTTGVIESAWAIAGNPLVSLSEQNLVSCDNADGNAGCGGGWPYKAIDYVAENGIDTEASYPYVSGGGVAPACTTSGHVKSPVKVASHYNIAQDEVSMAQYVAEHGPISIVVDAMTQLWWTYTGGIMTGCCNHATDHAVLIVGYGEENGTTYWIIKNSWGASWGEGGYVRLERGTDQCGITTAPVTAIIAGAKNQPHQW